MMTMYPVFKELEDKRIQATHNLKDLIEHYDDVSLPEIMKTSSEVFEMMRECAKADENVIYPHVCRNAKHTELLDLTRELHVNILNALDELLFIHVDEPENAYIQHLRELYTLMQTELYRTHNVVYPLAQNVLDRHEIKEIESELANSA